MSTDGPCPGRKASVRASFTSRQMTITVAKTISRLLVQVALGSPASSNSSAFLTQVQAVSWQHQESLKLETVTQGNHRKTRLRQKHCGGRAMQAEGFNVHPLWQRPSRDKPYKAQPEVQGISPALMLYSFLIHGHGG